MTRQQPEVDQGEDVVHGVVMLGDAQRPADDGAIGARVGEGRALNHIRGDARFPLGELQGVALDAFLVGLESRRRILDERLVGEAGVDDLARHRVGEGDVGAHVDAEPFVGPLGRGRPAWVHRIEARAAAHALQDVMEEDGVVFTGVRSPQEDDVRLFHLAVGAGAPTGTERCRQTDDARSVSGSVAAVDVVRAERDAAQLPGQEIHLVAGLGTAERADGVAAVLCFDAAEPVGGPVQRFLPRGLAEDAVVTDQRFGQASKRHTLRSRRDLEIMTTPEPWGNRPLD